MNLKKLGRNSTFWLALMLISTLPMTTLAIEPDELSWEELVPKGWNPNSLFDQFTEDEFAAMSDEQYESLRMEVQAMFDAAPTVELDGKTVKIPGFMLPLEFDDTNIKEFLLVPYFGACVHTPPPPANQVIHGKLDQQFTMSELFEPVWISGKLKTVRSQTSLGETGVSQSLNVETGYTMDVELVEPYSN